MNAPTKTAWQRDETLPIPGAPRTEFDFPDTFDHSQIPLEKDEWPVIVIGSSMVGMSLQLMLGFHGVKSLSFDRHPSTATRTRAALFLLRSIEIFRQLSLEPALRAASATNFDLDSGMLLTTALAGGTVLGAVQESDAARTAHVTPCARLWLTQNMYEPWVRERAGALGAQQRFGERVVWYAEDADGVLVVVQDGATRRCRKYRAAYLVACDGGRSPTRRRERVEWRGPGVLGNNISIYFRADLTALLGTRAKYGVTYVVNPRIRAIWRLDDSGKAGFLGVMGVEGRDGFEPDSVSEREAREMFALALGRSVEGLDMEIEEISYFTSAAYNSDCFASKQGRGRVFLAGDAAHVMPPTGGMGGNTGIQDAYNLAWKLALVVDGKASHGLLASYNSERQRVAGFTVQQAYSRFVNRVLKDPKLGHMKELPDDTVELGYRYPVGASVAEPDTDSSALWEDPYSPTATAGSRLPHVSLLSLNLEDISSLDLVKKHFVVLAAEMGSPWFSAAAKQDIPVQHFAVCSQSKEACDPENRFRQLCRLKDGQALLVRPDGYIGWRAPAVENGHEERLKEILERILWPEEQRT